MKKTKRGLAQGFVGLVVALSLFVIDPVPLSRNNSENFATVPLEGFSESVCQITTDTQEKEQEQSTDEVIAAGIKYLLGKQKENGSWGTDAKPLGRAGGAYGGITAMGLLALKCHEKAKVETDDEEKTVSNAIQNARKYLLDSLKIKGGFAKGFDVRHWNNALPLLALVRLYREKPDEELKAQIEKLIEALDTGQEKSGGWSYLPMGTQRKKNKDEEEEENEQEKKQSEEEFKKRFGDQQENNDDESDKGNGKKNKQNPPEKKKKSFDGSMSSIYSEGIRTKEGVPNPHESRPELGSFQMSFLTATCMIALLEAKAAGFKVSSQTIELATEWLKKMRKPSGAFKYFQRNNRTDGKIGSCSRNVACELALYLVGESDQEKLQWAVGQFFRYRHELEKTRKRGAKLNNVTTHVGKEAIAPYYYFFGYFSAVQALHFIDKNAQIPIDKSDEDVLKSPKECFQILKDDILEIKKESKKIEGSIIWMDSGWCGYDYGTAMALLVLSGQKLIGNAPKTGPAEDEFKKIFGKKKESENDNKPKTDVGKNQQPPLKPKKIELPQTPLKPPENFGKKSGRPGQLGAGIEKWTDDYRDELGGYKGGGVYVLTIVEDSAAEKGGMKESDVLISINDKKMVQPDDVFAAVLRDHDAGEAIKVIVLRRIKKEMKELTLYITLGERDPKADAQLPPQYRRLLQERNGKKSKDNSDEHFKNDNLLKKKIQQFNQQKQGE